MSVCPRISMMIGGASSGKSGFAERFVIASGKPKIYVATAQAFDAEMAKKITAHRESRAADGWQTIEVKDELPTQLLTTKTEQVVLVDCLTMWLNTLFIEEHDFAAAFENLQIAIGKSPANLVFVTNEVGQGIVPESSLGRRFRDRQGELNAKIAARSDLVVQVVAGLPLVLKGNLPEWMK